MIKETKLRIETFEELEVWKAARQLRLNVAQLVKNFPPSEKFRLSDQIIRSSRSVSANIAEGFGRFHYQENIQYCRQARGSLSETLDHLICAVDEKYIDANASKDLRELIDRCWKILNGYIAYLKRTARNDNSQ